MLRPRHRCRTCLGLKHNQGSECPFQFQVGARATSSRGRCALGSLQRESHRTPPQSQRRTVPLSNLAPERFGHGFYEARIELGKTNNAPATCGWSALAAAHFPRCLEQDKKLEERVRPSLDLG